MVVDALNPLVNQGAYYFPPPDPDSEDALDVYGVYFFSATFNVPSSRDESILAELLPAAIYEDEGLKEAIGPKHKIVVEIITRQRYIAKWCGLGTRLSWVPEVRFWDAVPSRIPPDRAEDNNPNGNEPSDRIFTTYRGLLPFHETFFDDELGIEFFYLTSGMTWGPQPTAMLAAKLEAELYSLSTIFIKNHPLWTEQSKRYVNVVVRQLHRGREEEGSCLRACGKP
ncbi:hypothetical protein P8C59_003622 [Phyllachora maydis]|uniref:Uncharacterized protein n=1 Tax=Phyllachora maydis TaxID=1825666 RepID=A0AAD9I245_9PEZI|nr:hypothetical protein P8C59_003622 [Phyllachora maydis]